MRTMFDTYDKTKWEAIKEARAHIVECMMAIDEYLTEEGLDKDAWFDAYRFIHKASELWNKLEKTVLVVRCRKLEEKEFGKRIGSTK